MKQGRLTVRDAAQQLGCTTKYVFDLLYSRRFDGAQKLDGRWSIPRAAVEKVRRLSAQRKRRVTRART